ncbi:MAG: tRNA (N(6)-L-threonylcarbamoyladenosine(37)-C(2))-methylthiotransferase MtaB [Clostridia bacterium]|nr:tRNA (N(6)-L-threonylcarbamoyladenosine(37)-C(2))-methylthiotransferase MtaB [Clostridia bacterium]
MNRIAFTTLGCKVNLYDSEAMAELFAQKGYEIVDFDDTADIYVINTCTVTNFGDKKSRQMIRRARRQNENSIIVATGCYAQVAPQTVAEIEGINIVIGTKDRGKVVEIVESYRAEKGVLNAVTDIKGEKEFERLRVSNLKDRTRAYIKIQEGCNRYCTYCIIPYARGPVRSRKPEDVIDEVKTLAKNGFKEVVLTGIHVASYGLDLENITLADIIEQVHSVEGIERIRFSSMEPKACDDEFVARMAKLPKVCEHYHLSLQSGSDTTLKKMNRRYTAEEYAAACERLRKAFPDAAITTDIIVGFPTETDENFNESYEFAEKVRLSKIHVFPYSPKTGTPAAKIRPQIAPDVKNERSHKMLELSARLNKEFMSRYISSTMEVLFERLEGDFYEGHTRNYIKVLCKSDSDLTNQLVNVKLTDIAGEETMYGRLM